MNYKARRLARKYNVEHKPALVVSVGDKHMAVYDARDLERKIIKFKIKAL